MKEKIQQLIRYHHLKTFFQKYERLLMPATLLFGVIVDSLTFVSISLASTFFLLTFYILITGSVIFFVHNYDERVFFQRFGFFRYVRMIAPFLLQFLFGALLSGTFVFYVFSASFAVSWPFIVLLIAVMITNDVFRQHYQQPVIQLSVYFFTIFLFFSVFLPFVFNDLGSRYFVGATVVSVLLMFGYVALLFRFAPKLKIIWWKLLVVASLLVVGMNALYFGNIIPPIPLILKEAVVAHDIDRTGNGYELQIDKKRWYDSMVPGQTITIQKNGQVVVYTAIFAPTDLRTNIIHEWQRYDDERRQWITRDRLSFAIRGARQEGFRGFSQKSVVPAGKWRVYVKTPQGQVLGRVLFTVVEDEKGQERETMIF